MDHPVPAEFRFAGWLLVSGAVFAILGAFSPPYRQWTSPVEEGFRAIAGNPIGWWSIHTGFFLGTIGCGIGLAMLASALHRRGGGEWALVAAVAFGFAAALWIANLAYRVSIWNWAAQAFVASGQTPEYFAPFHRWAGILFAIFSVVGYGSVAALGVAMFRADLGPAWLRWTTVVWGLTGGFVVGFNVPFIMYVPMLAWGVVLLYRPT